MRTIKILFLVLIIPITSFTQWEWQNPLPQGYNLNDVMILNDNNIYAVGDESTFMKSSDGGINWEVKLNIANTAHKLRSVIFINQQRGFIVSHDDNGDLYNGWLLTTSDGGNEWTAQAFGYNLHKVFFIDEHDGWIVGSTFGLPGNGRILKTTDGGLNWIESLFTTENEYFDVSFINNSIGWIVGNKVVIKTTDGGLEWTIINQTNNFLRPSCTFVSPLQGYIATEASIFKTFDGGLTWSQQYYDENLYFSDVEYLNNSVGFAVSYSYYTNFKPIILRTTDGGTNWIPTKVNNNLTSLSVLNSSELISVGFGGTIVKSNNGIDWTELNGGDNSIFFNDITFADDEVGYILGFSNDFQFDIIYKTNNSGENWSEQYRNPKSNFEQLNKLYFINASIGWAAGSQRILKTSNGGNTWDDQITNTGGYLHSICFYDSLNGFAVGTKMFRTSDGGTLWEEINLPPNVNRSEEVQFIEQNKIIIVGYGNGSTGYIYESSDFGNSWTLKFTSEFRLNKIIMVDELNGWASGTSYRVLKTTDGGENWTELIPSAGRAWIQSMYFENVNEGWLLKEDGQILVTTDSGLNWDVSIIKHDIASDLVFLNKDVGWMCGSNGAILKTNNGVFTSVENYFENKVQNYVLLSQNYPNPFNPSTTIEYLIPERSSVVIKVYDILGREVAKLVNEEKPAGNYNVELNGSNLTSGIYFYQIQAGEYIQAKKMILLK